jgi:predicted  nucleic acid-binding Zn-ribbon protein
MDLKQQPDGSLIGTSRCPADTQACPRCGHFFSPAVDGKCPSCTLTEALEVSRAQANESHRRAEALYQRCESLESTVRQHEHTISKMNVAEAQLRAEIENERDAHLEHLETIIVRIAAGARK